MKKLLALALTLVLLLAVTGCNQIVEKAGEVVAEKLTEEAAETTEKTTEEQTDQAKDDEADDVVSLDEIDLNLTGVALVDACLPLFSDDPMASDKALYVKVEMFDRGSQDPAEQYEVKRYQSEGNVSNRLEIITDTPEKSITMIVNGELGKRFLIFGTGVGGEIPNFGVEDGDENAIGFDFSMDEETHREMVENLIAARVEDYKGEKALYLEFKSSEYDVEKLWLSLERRILLKAEGIVNDQIDFSSEVVEFESGGNYDAFFEKPQDVEWLSMLELSKLMDQE